MEFVMATGRERQRRAKTQGLTEIYSTRKRRQGEQEGMSAQTTTARAAGSIRCEASSFGYPAVAIERRDDGTPLLFPPLFRPRRRSGDIIRPGRLPIACITGAERRRINLFMAERVRPAGLGASSPTRSCSTASRHHRLALLNAACPPKSRLVNPFRQSIDHA